MSKTSAKMILVALLGIILVPGCSACVLNGIALIAALLGVTTLGGTTAQ